MHSIALATSLLLSLSTPPPPRAVLAPAPSDLSVLRMSCAHRSSAIPITVRQLEALVRISEALAKMALQPFVSEQHVDEAIRLFKVPCLPGLMQVSTLDAALSGHLAAADGVGDSGSMEALLKIEGHIKKRFAIGSRLSEARLVSDLVEKVTSSHIGLSVCHSSLSALTAELLRGDGPQDCCHHAATR